ncbi:MAG: insulinase family protein [Proteobacteria bacterium]|nr:insulinase family protein [Pseudomonadota bacterium]
MKLLKYLCAAAMALTFAAPIHAQAQETTMTQSQEDIRIPFEEMTLDNGLRVFLLKDNTLPMISVNLWFDVGSKDEQPGRTGFAHLFEHLMFMGTDKVPNIDILLESGGGSNNASTREDVTNYYTVAPENMLETVLFIEADRFAHLADAMTQEKLDKQRDVVLNERKQSYENQPYGKI